MLWPDIPDTICDWLVKAAAPSYAIRVAGAGVVTSSHVGLYYNPASDQAGIFSPMAHGYDLARVKSAMHRAVGPERVAPFLSYQQLSDPEGTWIKVGYSQALRGAGELLNFFPGQYPGGIPNSPSPVAAMLTSGLLGAGLGYGGGRLLGSVLPGKTGDKLGRTGAVLGAALGAVPGAAWAGANALTGRGLNDPGLLKQPAGAEPVDSAVAIDGNNSAGVSEGSGGGPEVLKSLREHMESAPMRGLKFGADLATVELGSAYKTACVKAASSFGSRAPAREPHEADVNIDALGRTLWDSGASPALAASTMSGMYAARQLYDPRGRPGWVTGEQLGQLAERAVGDYAKGYMVGAVLNKLVGTPYSPGAFGAGNATLGIVAAVVPKLFGG